MVDLALQSYAWVYAAGQYRLILDSQSLATNEKDQLLANRKFSCKFTQRKNKMSEEIGSFLDAIDSPLQQCAAYEGTQDAGYVLRTVHRALKIVSQFYNTLFTTKELRDPDV